MKRLLLFPLLLVVACTEIYNNERETSSPTAPSTTTGGDRVEFRVFGSSVLGTFPVNIRHTDPINGVTIYSGGIPYFAAVSSREESIFLFVEGSGFGSLSTSTLQVQIFVNGRLFREGFSQGFTLQAQANGTYRR
jgi:hypothetical protein